MRLRVGPQVQQRVVQLEPIRLVADRLRLREQPHDDVQRFVHPLPLAHHVHPEHDGIRRQGARPHAHHHAPPREVVEEYHAVGDHQRVVIGQADDPGAELDVPGPLGSGSHEHFRRGNGLPATTMVLTDPGLVEPQIVEPLEQLQIALQAEGRVLSEPVERRQENPELHPCGQGHNMLSLPNLSPCSPTGQGTTVPPPQRGWP